MKLLYDIVFVVCLIESVHYRVFVEPSAYDKAAWYLALGIWFYIQASEASPPPTGDATD